ncbi:MAG TPA: D-alanyl-D-alanine carboxypeptidase family protein [Pyrinomonadaceae bacterium]|nr:D-alanyl-D-alanine carboxypeptidase family protein [Pyrinomonadaceae bacterium]
MTERRPLESLKSSNPRTVATRNLQLQSELKWMFGGKPQRGWYLYAPLVQSLIGTDQGADTTGFAAALSRWQLKQGLQASGILDEESLYAMVGHWQSLRIRDRNYPQPDQLVTGSLEDFYDQSRPEELRQVHLEAYTAYKQMILAAKADPLVGPTLADDAKYLKIISSFRSREYQEKLRRESPNAGRAGLAVNSPHFTGRALDIYVGGEPVETKDSNRSIQIQTPVYLWLTRNAHRFGFRPYFYEPWHWEYVR